jgi:hypothetical protein
VPQTWLHVSSKTIYWYGTRPVYDEYDCRDCETRTKLETIIATVIGSSARLYGGIRCTLRSPAAITFHDGTTKGASQRGPSTEVEAECQQVPSASPEEAR